MDNINEIVKKKLLGLIQSIEKMSEKDKYRPPTRDYGKEINKLFQITRENSPELEDFIPTNLEFYNEGVEDEIEVSTPWLEIHSKLNQLYQLLN